MWKWSCIREDFHRHSELECISDEQDKGVDRVCGMVFALEQHCH